MSFALAILGFLAVQTSVPETDYVEPLVQTASLLKILRQPEDVAIRCNAAGELAQVQERLLGTPNQWKRLSQARKSAVLNMIDEQLQALVGTATDVDELPVLRRQCLASLRSIFTDLGQYHDLKLDSIESYWQSIEILLTDCNDLVRYEVWLLLRAAGRVRVAATKLSQDHVSDLRAAIFRIAGVDSEERARAEAAQELSFRLSALSILAEVSGDARSSEVVEFISTSPSPDVLKYLSAIRNTGSHVAAIAGCFEIAEKREMSEPGVSTDQLIQYCGTQLRQSEGKDARKFASQLVEAYKKDAGKLMRIVLKAMANVHDASLSRDASLLLLNGWNETALASLLEGQIADGVVMGHDERRTARIRAANALSFVARNQRDAENPEVWKSVLRSLEMAFADTDPDLLSAMATTVNEMRRLNLVTLKDRWIVELSNIMSRDLIRPANVPPDPSKRWQYDYLAPPSAQGLRAAKQTLGSLVTTRAHCQLNEAGERVRQAESSVNKDNRAEAMIKVQDSIAFISKTRGEWSKAKNLLLPNDDEKLEALDDKLARHQQYLNTIKPAKPESLWRWLLRTLGWTTLGLLFVWVGVVICWLVLYLVSPQSLVRAHQLISRIRIPSKLTLGFEVPATYVMLLGLFLRSPRVLDNWILKHGRNISNGLRDIRSLRENPIFVELAGAINGVPFLDLSNRLRDLFISSAPGKQGRHVVVSGAMGMGKTALACQVARLAMRDFDAPRIPANAKLPIFLSEEDGPIENDKVITERVRDELQKYVGGAAAVSLQLVTALLAAQRLIVIADDCGDLGQRILAGGDPAYPIRACLITSRQTQAPVHEDVVQASLVPLSGQAQRDFLREYMVQTGDLRLFNEEEVSEAYDELEKLVGDDAITPFFAKLYVAHLVAAKKSGQGYSRPESIPSLMLQYIDAVNRNLRDRWTDRAVQELLTSIAWACCEACLRPDPLPEHQIAAAVPATQEGWREYVLDRLQIMKCIPPDKMAFTFKALAKYSAAIHLIRTYGSHDGDWGWDGFFKSLADYKPSEVIEFLYILRECCAELAMTPTQRENVMTQVDVQLGAAQALPEVISRDSMRSGGWGQRG